MRVSTVVSAALAASLVAGCGGSSTPTGDHPRARQPQDVARSEASRLIGLVRPPAGARPSDSSPVKWEDDPPQQSSTPDLVDLPRWWTVDSAPDQVLGWLSTHGVRGKHPAGRGTSSGPDQPDVSYLIFRQRPKQGLDDETVLVTVTSDGHGGSAIRADAQVVWLPARDPAETIRGQSAVDVTAYDGIPKRTLGHRVLTGAAARRLIAVINQLPTAARGEHSCGADTGYRLVVRAGPLTFDDDVACFDVAVTDGRRSLPALQSSGRFVHAVTSALGLPTFPRAPRPRRSPG